jgi:hypothetical protein
MITIVGRWEKDILDPDLEMRILRQLKGAYGIDRIVMTPIVESMKTRSNVEQFDTMEEALATCEGNIVFLEPKGTTSLSDLPEGDITFVTSDAYMNNMHLAEGHITCKINSPKATDMFAVNAVAIALAYRYGQ